MSAPRPTPTCFGCGTPVADEPGLYYCDDCVAKQQREHADELTAFDAFHAFADRTVAS